MKILDKLRRYINPPTPERTASPELTFEQVEARYHRDRLSIQEDLQRALERIKIEEMEIRFNHDKQLARLEYDFELWQKRHPETVYTGEKLENIGYGK